MPVAEEIREQQKKALSTMSFKEKFAYFWDYYKIHSLVAVFLLIFAISLIHQIITHKDCAFYAMVLNTGTPEYEDDTSEKWAEEFGQYAQIDTDEFEVSIDTSISLSQTTNLQYRAVNQQKIAAMIQTGSINAMLAETETFEQYAQYECYYTLEEVMSAEEIEKYRPFFYYTDAATFEQDDDSAGVSPSDMSAQTDSSTFVINHRDPSTMEQPVAVGIVITDSKMIKDSGYYKYLGNSEYDYQGHPSDVILGIPASNQEPEMAIRFLEYLLQ